MPSVHLTDLFIKSLKPTGERLIYWDDGLAGFGCRVSLKGTKSWLALVGPKRKLTTFARYPDVPLKDARAHALKLMATPVPVTSAVRFENAVIEFLADAEPRLRPRTHQDYRYHLNRHFVPHWRVKRLSDISDADVDKRLQALADTPSEQRHAFVYLRAFFRWAVRRGYIENAPLKRVAAPKVRESRERVLSDAELKAVLARAIETPYPFGQIVQLLIYTGQRRGEVAALRWDWIDTQAKTITLPASITKNKRTHTFPYGDRTAGALDSIPKTGDYLFPAARSHVGGKPTTTFNGWGKPKAAFDEGLPVEPWTLHDLRRTFATGLAALSTPIHITEKLLNHVSGTISGVAAIYNRHAYVDEMREAISAWEGKLTALAEGGQAEPSR